MQCPKASIIGVSQRILFDPRRNETTDSIDQKWTVFFEAFGARMVPIPNRLKDPIQWANDIGITGILLTGGGDVSPYLSSQGEQTKGQLASSDYLLEPRDETECALIEASKHNDMPVLGVCRGLQQINLFHGGSLKPVEEHVALEHELASCNDDGHYIFPKRVNSFHAWGIYNKDLGDGMVPLAMAGDTVEAARHKKFKHVGIMWHPERAREFDVADIELFKDFFGAAI